jgi:WD40 repeat protein
LAGSALAVSPDGKRMLVCGWSTTVLLLDLPAGRAAHQLAASDDPTHNDWVHAVAFHPTDGTAVTVSREGVLRRWDAATGKRLAEWSVAPEAMDVTFSPKGDYIALSGDPSQSGMGRVDVWEVTSGKERLRLNGQGPRVAWSPDGRWLATGDAGGYEHKDRHVLIWDVGTMLKK